MKYLVKRFLTLFAAAALLTAAGAALGVRAAYTYSETEGAFNTAKTDRTLIKEIYARQDETLKLLKSVKEELQILRSGIRACAQ